jgi:hypothetical protein
MKFRSGCEIRKIFLLASGQGFKKLLNLNALHFTPEQLLIA